MTFISPNVEKSSLTIMKDQLQFREMILSQQLNTITRAMGDIALEHKGEDDYEPDCDVDLIYYESQQEIYDSEKENIESQLKALNAEIESYDKIVDTNIKQDCKTTTTV